MMRRQLRRLQVLILRRLIIPLFRSPHPPEYTARGVFIGLLIGCGNYPHHPIPMKLIQN